MSIKDIIERVGGKLNEETNKWEIPNKDWMVVEQEVVLLLFIINL